MKKLLLLIIIPFLSFGQCVEGDLDNDGICDEIDNCVGTWIPDVSTGTCGQFTSQGADACNSYSGCEWTYSWGGWVTGGSSDCVGSYEIDNGYCDEFELIECDLNVEFYPFGVNCEGECFGGVDIDVSGGNPPYTWIGLGSQNVTNINVTSLCAGSYPVTIFDSNDCQIDTVIIITQPEPIGVFFDIQDAICDDETGSIYITEIFGGNPPYSIYWENPSTELTPVGTYECVIIDFSGCEYSFNYSINSINGECETTLDESAIQKKIITTVDILGRESINNKGFQLHIYDDGTVEKKYLIK